MNWGFNLISVSETKENLKLRRFPLNVRAISAKIKLPKNYSCHGNSLSTVKTK